MTQAMIEEISLPFYAAELRSNSFVVADQLRKRGASVNPDQRMQMVRHKQEKVKIPSPMVVINPCGIEKDFRSMFAAQLI